MQHSRHFDSIDGTCTRGNTRCAPANDASNLTRLEGRLSPELTVFNALKLYLCTEGDRHDSAR